MHGYAAAAVALLAAAPACRREEDQRAHPPAEPPLPALVAPAASLMPVRGYGSAVLVSPVGATRPMPIVVAVLGIGDTPESQCAVWRELVGARAFVVCPRFTPHYVRVTPEPPEGATLEGDEAVEPSPREGEGEGQLVQSGFRPTELEPVEREIDAAVSALRAIFPKHAAEGPIVYTGFSRGAFLGASLVAKNPGKYARAIFVEGGQSAWNPQTATAFARGGGRRVLFACGQPSCMGEADAAAALLARAGVPTRVVHGEGEGHGYKRQVKEQLRQSFDWVVEGDPAWRQLLATAPSRR